MSVFYKHPLPLPLGEVAERSEDGEGKPGCNALSVAYGDSSPKGRAKGGVPRHEKWRASPLPLPLGEVAEQSEDGEGKPGCKALSVACGDSSPKGRAKGLFLSFQLRREAGIGLSRLQLHAPELYQR